MDKTKKVEEKLSVETIAKEFLLQFNSNATELFLKLEFESLGNLNEITTTTTQQHIMLLDNQDTWKNIKLASEQMMQSITISNNKKIRFFKLTNPDLILECCISSLGYICARVIRAYDIKSDEDLIRIDMLFELS